MKRQTKSEKDAAAFAVLRQRVRDIVAGATGDDPSGDDFYLTLEAASRAIPALRKTFGEEGRDYMWQAHCLDRFETVDSITDFLFRNGVRTS